MTLGEYIEFLKKYNPDDGVVCGFGEPNSWRGSYDELCFYPSRHVTIGWMLKEAESANGAIYNGYKGGQYKMDLDTPVNFESNFKDYSGGDFVAKNMLRLMFGDGFVDDLDDLDDLDDFE